MAGDNEHSKLLFDLAELMNAVSVKDYEVPVVQTLNANAAGSSSTLVLSSSVVGVFSAQGTPSRQQTEKKKDLEPKPKGPLKRHPPASSPAAKRQKRSVAMGTLTNLTVEDIEACIKVGKLGHDMFIKWNSEAADSEKGNVLEAKQLWLDGKLLDKSMKLTTYQKAVAETREERDRLYEERDALKAKVETLSTAEEELQRWRKALSDTEKKVPGLEQQV